MPEPFEQQLKESAKAFAAFSVYLNLGPERSLAATAHKLSKSEQLLKRWSRRFDWQGRVAAHAAHYATVERQATEVLTRGKAAAWLTRQIEHREEEWKVRGEVLDAAREALRRWKAKPERCGSLEGIARLLELASKLGRLASGMPTDRTELTGDDGGPIRIELTAALNKIYGAPLPGEVVDVEAFGATPADARETRALPGGTA